MVTTHSVCIKPLQLQISTQSESDHILLHSSLHTVKHLREITIIITIITIIIIIIIYLFIYYYSKTENTTLQETAQCVMSLTEIRPDLQMHMIFRQNKQMIIRTILLTFC